MLAPVALKRKLAYVSDYIFQEIQTDKVIDIFKTLKYRFKNPHFKNVVFSQQMLDKDVDQFVESCKDKVQHLEKQKEEEETIQEEVISSSENEEFILDEENMSESLQNVKDSKSKSQGDSLMIPLDRPSLTGSTLADAIANAISDIVTSAVTNAIAEANADMFPLNAHKQVTVPSSDEQVI